MSDILFSLAVGFLAIGVVILVAKFLSQISEIVAFLIAIFFGFGLVHALGSFIIRRFL